MANTAPMGMPKTAVYEDDLPTRWKYDVGSTGQLPPMQIEPVPKGVEKSTHHQFRGGILSAYAGHQ
jgi:hypothetical protein